MEILLNFPLFILRKDVLLTIPLLRFPSRYFISRKHLCVPISEQTNDITSEMKWCPDIWTQSKMADIRFLGVHELTLKSAKWQQINKANENTFDVQHYNIVFRGCVCVCVATKRKLHSFGCRRF